MAQGYLRYADEYLKYDRNGDDGLVAAEWAVKLTPYAAQPRIALAVLLERKNQPAAALDESRLALKLAPGNPFVWQAHAHLKLRQNQMDDELTRALMQVDRLAPRSFLLHERNARLGLAYWNWGRPEHRQFWEKSIEFVLSKDARFLRFVLVARHEELFCREFRNRTPYLDQWCRGALMARRSCYASQAKPHTRAWCKRIGLIADSYNG
jgi:hypothetical protein